MPRKVKSAKPLIYVFCEGESEQAYADYLKKTFSDVTVLKGHQTQDCLKKQKQSFQSHPNIKTA